MELVQPGCRIPKDEWNNFKKAVKGKHGITSGVTSVELAKALKFYRTHGMPDDELDDTSTTSSFSSDLSKNNSHTHTTGNDHEHYPGSSTEKLDLVLSSFKEEFKASKKVHPKVLKKFIMKECGVVHPQTIKGYADYLESNNVISRNTGDIFYENIVYDPECYEIDKKEENSGFSEAQNTPSE